LAYQVVDGEFHFFQRRLVGLTANGQPLGPQINAAKLVDKTPLRAGDEFVLAQASALTPVDVGDPTLRNLGAVSQVPAVYSVEAGNRVQNPDLAAGVWHRTVEDCNDYDPSPLIAMNVVIDDQRPNKVLELTADRHVACTGPAPVAITSGQPLMVNFDYRVKQGRQAGYQLRWTGPGVSAQDAVERNYLPVTDNSWRTLRRLVTPPPGATNLRVMLEAFPNDQRPVEGIARYTAVRVSALTLVDTAPVNIDPQYTDVPLPSGTTTVSVTDPTLTGHNLVTNPSLENGLWQPNVGDCNAYNDNPAIGQRLTTRTATDGRYALELSARRHIACTGPPPVPVGEGRTYLLSVDYQSPNAKTASVAISFNDPNHSRTGNTAVTIHGSGWHTYNQTVVVPFGATQATITLSASAANPPTSTIIDRYDNLRLVEVVPAAGQYYLTTAGPAGLTAPGHISFSLPSPTKKIVRVTSAATPFYLTMSEAYHPGWRLELSGARAQGPVNGWAPWAHPQAIATNTHFALDDLTNGWYVDPAAVCRARPPGCSVNQDGTYNLQLIVEFVPQRWFYLGLVISVGTLVGCVAYTVYAWQKHKNSP
jgi:hypothetical protein